MVNGAELAWLESNPDLPATEQQRVAAESTPRCVVMSIGQVVRTVSRVACQEDTHRTGSNPLHGREWLRTGGWEPASGICDRAQDDGNPDGPIAQLFGYAVQVNAPVTINVSQTSNTVNVHGDVHGNVVNGRPLRTS